MMTKPGQENRWIAAAAAVAAEESKGPEHGKVAVDQTAHPPVSTLPGIDDPASFWPASLGHLGLPYDRGGEYITLAEISDADVNGFSGYRNSALALVPHDQVKDVLQSTGSTDHEVQAHGPRPIVRDDGPPHESGFWIRGLSRERFEPLVNAWQGGDTAVVVPDNSLLMVFGLVPRHTGGGKISWDDLQGPTYDVVRSASISDHQLPKELRQRAVVEIRRDYLLEYCRIKQAAAVCFYYENRFSLGDEAFEQVMAGRTHEDFHLPGRLLTLQYAYREGSRQQAQLSQVWGRQMAVPKGMKRIIEAEHLPLTWPDIPEPVTRELARHSRAMVYVKDQVLCDYEGRPAFEIIPISGSISYRGQWSVGFCQRIGRDHIKLELRKLYEGAPPSVIEHWHQYAVPEAQALADQPANGSKNIALRAEELIHAFLSLTQALAKLSEQLDRGHSQKEIGGYDRAAVDYSGWWTVKEFMTLACVAPLNLSRDGFLDRTVDLVALWESLQPAPLRLMLLKAGVDTKSIAPFKTTKLLATLCQLATLTKNAGHQWPCEVEHVIADWHKDIRIPALQRLFSLNQMRQKAAHRTGNDFEAELEKDLSAFGLEPGALAAGWGLAVDAVYDGLIEDIEAIGSLIAN